MVRLLWFIIIVQEAHIFLFVCNVLFALFKTV